MINIQNFDILTYLTDKNIETVFDGKNVSSGWVGVQCPFCNDPSFHLGINLQSKLISCWRCSAKGSVIRFIASVENCSFSKAKDIVSRYRNLGYIHFEEETDRVERVELPKAASKKFPGDPMKYLGQRGFDPDFLIQKYDLSYCGLVGDYKFRILIPVYFKNKLVTFTTRDTTNQATLPYKHLSKEKSVMPIKSVLYNMDNAIDKAILVEGVFDAWRLGDGAIASFGTEVTDEQKLLLKSFSRLFIMFDSDATDRAYELSYQLAPLIQEVFVVEMKEGDPCNLSNEEVLAIRKDLVS